MLYTAARIVPHCVTVASVQDPGFSAQEKLECAATHRTHSWTCFSEWFDQARVFVKQELKPGH